MRASLYAPTERTPIRRRTRADDDPLFRSRFLGLGDRSAVRLRLVAGGSGRGIEVSQLTRRDHPEGREAGYASEAARCFVALDQVEAFAAELLAFRAEVATVSAKAKAAEARARNLPRPAKRGLA